MTAEIVVMNKEAVALAADSAATVGGQKGQKIFTSVNKLFALSKYHPVGIMVYGRADFMGVPWETIIKVYRARTGTAVFAKLQEYADDFISFLGGGNPLFPEAEQRRYVRTAVASYLRLVKEEILEQTRTIIDKKGQVTDAQVMRTAARAIGKHFHKVDHTESLPRLPDNHLAHLLRRYRDVIDDAIREVFEKLPLSARSAKRLERIGASLFCKKLFADDLSGVVIAGFGQQDPFPSLVSFQPEAVAGDRVKYKVGPSEEIDFNQIGIVIPFAQTEMVQTFMEGVNPYLDSHMHGYLRAIFEKYPELIVSTIGQLSNSKKRSLAEKLKKASNEIFEEWQSKMNKYRRENHIDPILSAVALLPKDELTAMAESLVSLTSFKRKVTMESETVGGPIDVAAISKGDGFIWIKRKHYFKPELNPQFFANYYREFGSNEETQ